MRRIFQLCVLAFSCIGLFGCPYESQIPISKPTIPVDTRLLGKWSCKDEVYNSYTITKASPTEYKIVQENIVGTSKYIGYLSEVKGSTFMNLYSDSTQTFYLYKIKLEPIENKFLLIPLSDRLPTNFKTMDGLKEFIEKNMNLQSCYSDMDKAEFVKDDVAHSSAVLN